MRRFLTSLNLARLALLLVFSFTLYQLSDMKPPAKTAWARHMAEGKDPTVAEHVQVGLWYGAVSRAGITGLLLVLSFAWSLKAAAPKNWTFDLQGTGLSQRTFWATLLVILILAAAIRVPRMNHSFWGDEADAVATYIHGQYRPFKKKDPQGPLYFEQPSWGETFFSARHGPNNHVLFSLMGRLSLATWQKVSRLPESEFTEWVIRVPCLIAGLGSLAALACLLRLWRAPALGLLATSFMAVHPWHVRYSTEARGYAFALCLLPLVAICLTCALEKRDWRYWLAFALTEFLLMYSWAGAAYPLAFINLAIVGLIMTRSDRWMLLVRCLTANLLAAAAFISLYAPQVTQIKQYNATHLWMKGLPMDEIWLHNLLSSPFTGMPYHGPLQAGSATLSWNRLLHESPMITTMGFALIIIAFVIGLVCLWRRPAVAALTSAAFAAAVVSALHFKFVIGDELRVWYLIFTVPFVAICIAAGLAWLSRRIPQVRHSLAARSGFCVALLTFIIVALWPMNQALMAYPAEDFKGVLAATRSKHEIFYPKGRAEVFTCWLWRFSALYDPRGEIHVRDENSLRQRMAEAHAAEGGLFIILGYRPLAEAQSPGMLKVLEDPDHFEKVATFPAYDPIQTLEVFKMKVSQ